MNDMALFREGLKRLVGKECWRVTGGYGTGTRINLHLGTKVEKHLTKQNGEEYTILEGEYVLFVECVWRIDGQDDVVVSSHPYYEQTIENPFNQLMIQGLKTITN